MVTTYDQNLKAHVTTDANKKVRHIRHSQEFFISNKKTPSLSGIEYLQTISDSLQIPKEQLKSIQKKVSFLEPREQGIEYQLNEEKQLFDSTTISYYQTYKNVPVWRKGLSVKIKQNPYRVVGATINTEDELEGTLPSKSIIERYKRRSNLISSSKSKRLTARQQEDNTSFILNALGIGKGMKFRAKKSEGPRKKLILEPLNGRLFIYKYDSTKRYAGNADPPDEKQMKEKNSLEAHGPAFIKIPPISGQIQNGRAYLVAEIIFKYPLGSRDEMVWLVLIELETNSILYIEPMTLGVNGLVFRRDPIVKTGDLTITSDKGNTILNPHRDNLTLNDLDSPSGGTQDLRGTFVVIQDIEFPGITPPTALNGTDFTYEVRTNNFSAINAYYHQTELFRTIESLGFPHRTYFDGTNFPIPVDHRGVNSTNCPNGDCINAHWSSNGRGGTDHLCYALCDTTNFANPLGRAVDPWVHWHEMGGHGTLGDFVDSGSFGFAHSAGDGLAAIQMDPESALRGKPERFRYAPFRPFTTERRFDRDVAAGWAWGGGTNDDGDYGSEQILATCHFRIYRSIGGDHENLGRRLFASRMATYLILRTISNLTPGTNPDDAEIWCEEMQDTDLEDWTSEGISGGAYNKVIRWAFEKQGCYQPAGAPSPVTTAGSPPEIDVYINDGRNGEYEFQAIHWHNMSMWNRSNPDGLSGHQNGREGVTNHMYGKVKNRGTSAAKDVNVRSFHCLPGAGLRWPADFTEMSPIGGLTLPSLGANNTEEITVGPFEWTPNVNVHGHDCALMVVSTEGDPSNIDNLTGSEIIEEWRLVPNDNNVGQRNVVIVPGGGGGEGLMQGLHKHVFFVGNSLPRKAIMELKVELPALLTTTGWKLNFEGIDDNNEVELKPGEKRKIVIDLVAGNDFTKDQVRNSTDRNITIYLYGNDMSLGGMTYQLDPDMKESL
jgi:zinc metalloprotease ZmpB